MQKHNYSSQIEEDIQEHVIYESQHKVQKKPK